VPVVSKQLDASVKLPAELAPDESVALFPRVQGFVEEVNVDRGSVVKKGQLLARLVAPELAAQRAEAESKTSAARSTFDRLKSASATPGAIAGHDLEVAEARFTPRAHASTRYVRSRVTSTCARRSTA